jgi:CheY-like chemotaxis protein
VKSRVSVLVVDKSQIFSMYLALLLNRMGLKSLRVDDYETAREVLSRGIIDVLIVGDQGDLEPVHALIQKLAPCVDKNTVPIIAISKHADPLLEKTCYEAGCHSYLLKPVQPKQLHNAIYAQIMPPSERRMNLRSRVDMVAWYSIDRGVSGSLEIQSLSGGGALISCDRFLPVGTKFSLDLVVDDHAVHLLCRVVYDISNIKNTNHHYGILFENICRQEFDMIDRYIEINLDDYSNDKIFEKILKE